MGVSSREGEELKRVQEKNKYREEEKEENADRRRSATLDADCH